MTTKNHSVIMNRNFSNKDPVVLLLKNAGIDVDENSRVPDRFQTNHPRKLEIGETWNWQTLTHALIYVSRLYADSGADNVVLYLESVFPADFSVARLSPNAAEALAEILNIWGACCRQQGALDTAIDLFTAALKLTRRPRIRQHVMYNRGYARLQKSLLAADLRFRDMSRRTIIRGFHRAEKDLSAAAELNPDDSMAWSQRGFAAMMIASMTGLTVGRRLRWYGVAIASYESALRTTARSEEQNAIWHNLRFARDKQVVLGRYKWFARLRPEPPVYGGSESTPQDLDGGLSLNELEEIVRVLSIIDMMKNGHRHD
jgi:tetratricopeptide (TPR) repeat protein